MLLQRIRAPFTVTVTKVSIARIATGLPDHKFTYPPQRLIVGISVTSPSTPASPTDMWWGQADVTSDDCPEAWEELVKLAEQLAGSEIDLMEWKSVSQHEAPGAAINQALGSFVSAHAPKLKRKVAVDKVSHPPKVDVNELATLAEDAAFFPTAATDPAEPQNDFSHHLLPGASSGPNGTAIREKLALSMGFNALRLSKHVLVISDPDSDLLLMFDQGRSPVIGHGGAKVAVNKALTRQLLNDSGLPVAAGFSVSANKLEAARQRAEEIGFPLVVKPAKGSKGEGITTAINSWETFQRAITEASGERFRGNRVVVERHVDGDDYRFLVNESGVLSVARREIGSFVGNGRQTILELITAYNAQRQKVPSSRGTIVDITPKLEAKLAEQGHHLYSVPAWDERVLLTNVGNVSQGALAVEVLDETHPSLGEAAVKAIRASGMALGGVDMIIPDNRVSIWDQTVTITEINGTPSFIGHYFPNFGPGRNVFEHELRDHIAQAGLSQPDISDDLKVRLTVRGDVASTGYCEWMVNAARHLGVNGSVSRSTSTDEVVVYAQGPADQVGVLVRRSIEGPASATPVEVFTEQHTGVIPSGFSYRR